MTIGKFPGVVLNKLNVYLLSDRLSTITNWAIENVPEVKDFPVGYFGASTGTAAAMEASTAVYNPNANKIYAIVSIGGRPDLVYHENLRNVKASTLLVVGAKDSKLIIDINKKAIKQLKNAKSKDLVIIADAGHLFNEKGCIMQVANIAAKWYTNSLGKISNRKSVVF